MLLLGILPPLAAGCDQQVETHEIQSNIQSRAGNSIPNHYTGSTFAHDRSDSLVASIDDEQLIRQIDSLINTVANGEYNHRNSGHADEWNILRLGEEHERIEELVNELTPPLQQALIRTLEQSFYEGTFYDYFHEDYINSVLSVKAINLRTNYPGEFEPPFHVDGGYGALLLYVQRNDDIQDPYGTLVAVNQKDSNLLGKKPSQVANTRWRELAPGELNLFYGVDLSNFSGIQSPIHTSPTITQGNKNRKFIELVVYLEHDARSRIMAARISQQLMSRADAMSVASRLFNTQDPDYIEDHRMALEVLTPLVDDTKSWTNNDIFRVFKRDFHGPGACVGTAEKDKLRAFLLDHGARAGCFSCF